MRKSSVLFAYLLLIQLSISCAGPARSSRRSEVNSSLAKKDVNIQRLARDDPVEDVKSSGDDIITTTSESSIPTTEDDLPVDQEVINDAVSMGPSVLLLDEPIPESIAIEPEVQDVTEPVPEEPEVIQDVKDLVVDSKIETPEIAEILPAQVEPESSSAAPNDLPLNSPVRVPMIPADLETSTTPLSDPIINSSEEDSNFSSLKFKKPIGMKKTTSSGTKYGIQYKLEQPKRRPFVYQDAVLNPYLSEEQDQPIYLPPTFSALPLAVSVYSGEEDFPSRPFGTHPPKPKKLNFPRISNTDENFDLHVDWW